jgi:hypothetical protein
VWDDLWNEAGVMQIKPSQIWPFLRFVVEGAFPCQLASNVFQTSNMAAVLLSKAYKNR